MPLDLRYASLSEATTMDGDHLLSPVLQRKHSNLSDWEWKPQTVERISINLTEEDHEPFLGAICLLIYIGVWVLSSISVPVVVVLLLFHFYTSAFILAIAIALCYVPITPSQPLRNFARKNFGRYFKEASVRFEHVPDPLADRPTILCVNPHGVFSLSWAHCYLTEELHHVVYCFSHLLRLNPFLRIVTGLTGHPSDANKETVIEHMKNKRSIALIPGAWHEATIHYDKADRMYIQKRQGFVKYALEFGYTITPTYCFGERSTYFNVQGCFPLRFWLNDRKILAALPWGRWWCPFLPKPTKLHTVVGAPIELPHIPHPTAEDVNRWHQVYMDEMSELFSRYKVQFYGEESRHVDLELW